MVKIIPFLHFSLDLCIFCWLYGLMNGCYFVAARLGVSRARILVVIQRPIRSRAIATKALVVAYTKTSKQSPEPLKRDEYRSSDLARRLGLFITSGITFFLPRWLGRGVFLLTWAEFCILVPEVYVTKPILVVSGRLNMQLNCQFLDVIFSWFENTQISPALEIEARNSALPSFAPRLGYTYEVTFKV